MERPQQRETSTADHTVDYVAAEAAVRELLKAIGEDPERPGLVETPARVARAYAQMLEGRNEDPVSYLRTQFAASGGEYVLQRDIHFASVCEHHLLPFLGVAHIAYVPNGHAVTGLSKLARVVTGYARRLQLQDRMTEQIADALMTGLEARGVLVITQARHGCMSARGVEQPTAQTTSMVTRGCLKVDTALRTEIIAMLMGIEGTAEESL